MWTVGKGGKGEEGSVVEGVREKRDGDSAWEREEGIGGRVIKRERRREREGGREREGSGGGGGGGGGE